MGAIDRMRGSVATLVVFALIAAIVTGSPLVAMADPLGEPPPAEVVGDPAGDALGALILWFALPFVIIWALGSMGRSRRRTTYTRTVRRHSRTIPQDVKIAVTLRDGGKCRVCGSKKDLQYDHIYPWSLGGRSDDPNNIQLLCGYHNRLKGNR